MDAPFVNDPTNQGAASQPPQFDLAAVSSAEQEAFERFKRTYYRQVPAPVRPAGLDSKRVGGMFWLYLATSIAAILLASMRTASQFFQAAAATGNATLGYIEAVTAVLAIEGGLVVYAAARAVRRKEVSDHWLVLAIVLMVLISTVAGIGQSIHLIDNIDPTVLNYFQYALAILLGAGTSIVAYVGGEVLGQQIVIAAASREESAEKYKAELAEYNKQLLHSWQTSDERKIIRGGLRSRAKTAGKGSSLTGSVSELKGNYEGTFGHGRRPPVQTARVNEYMDEVFNTTGRVASFSEVQNALGLSKSTASKLRNAWIAANDIQVAIANREDSDTEHAEESPLVEEA